MTTRDLWKASQITDAEYITALEAQLAQCFRLSGADSDGDEDWRIAGRAFRRNPHAVPAPLLHVCDERCVRLAHVYSGEPSQDGWI